MKKSYCSPYLKFCYSSKLSFNFVEGFYFIMRHSFILIYNYCPVENNFQTWDFIISQIFLIILITKSCLKQGRPSDDEAMFSLEYITRLLHVLIALRALLSW